MNMNQEDIIQLIRGVLAETLPPAAKARGGAALRYCAFGVVSQWEKDKVAFTPMEFGDPNTWATTAVYRTENEVALAFAPRQIFNKRGVAGRTPTPCLLIHPYNCDRPIIIPLHPEVDTWNPKPSLPWTEPAPGELETPATVVIPNEPPGGWNDINTGAWD